MSRRYQHEFMVKLSLYLRKLVPSKELYDRDRVLKAILEKTDFQTMDEVEATYGKNCIDQIFKENNSMKIFMNDALLFQ